MNEIRLIVNADDFARSKGVDRGILRAHHEGIVSTTTALMNQNNAVPSILLAHSQEPELGFGVHLNITFGKPLNPANSIASLVATDDNFYDFRKILSGQVKWDIAHVEAEWRSQIERFLDTGLTLDHLDSHHHAAVFQPELFELFLELAYEYGCGVRNPIPLDLERTDLLSLYPENIIRYIQDKAAELISTRGIRHPDALLASFFAEQTTSGHLIEILESLKSGVYELMCHPGMADDDLRLSSSYAGYRVNELHVLTDPAIGKTLTALGIKLHTFKTAWVG